VDEVWWDMIPQEYTKTAVITQGLQVQLGDQLENEAMIDLIPVKVCIVPINIYIHFCSTGSEVVSGCNAMPLKHSERQQNITASGMCNVEQTVLQDILLCQGS
jgi:hypothetical protein